MKKTLFAALLALVGISASAQEKTEEYIFQPHWYVQAQGGVQHTLGEIDFSDLLSPNAQVAVGYNFNKVLGARLAVNAWQSKAGSDIKGYKYNWKWNYVAPSIDVTANLTNLFCEYNPKRLVNVGIFGGIGANIASGNDEAQDAAQLMISRYGKPIVGDDQYVRYLWDGSRTSLLGRFGLNVDFRLCDAVSVGVEANANTLDDHFNSKKAGNSDWYFNVLAGVKINLGKTYTTRPIEPVAVAPTVVEKEVIKEVVKEVEKVQPIRRDVFFSIRSTEITLAENAKVKEIAAYMKKYPNSKVKITGYADKGTGNAVINRALSEKRARVVADALINNHGIAASRISTDAKGDTEQPYEENVLNRVSICIAE